MFLPVLTLSLLCLANAKPSQRIVVGTTANLGQFPFMALIRHNGLGICGGAIVANSFVISAAHCLDKFPVDEMDVEVGGVVRGQGVTYPVEWQKYHPDYTTTNTNDIGILKIKGEFTFNENVQIVPVSHDLPFSYETGTIMGYGVEKMNGTKSETLQYVNVNVRSYEHCSTYIKFPADKDVCVEGPEGDGACSGDSGGPLVSDSKGETELIGIASRVWSPCGQYWDIYSRVDAHLEWFNQFVTL